MVVIMMEKVPVSLRGEITRWLLELRPGVFVGNISALVREKLWEHICEKTKGGAAMLLHSAANEQGYLIRSFGDTNRKIRDFEGLQLIVVSENKIK
jgi:CRISPR-associated protein Cas2